MPALFICSIFVILPILLLTVYPCRCFHRCLNSCGLRLQTLHIFMDAFQGSHKLHPCDMRYFSAFYLFLWVLMLAHAELFVSPLTLYISGMISFTSAALVVLFQPYKVSAHNTTDSVLMLLMGIYFISSSETSLVASLHYGSDWTFPSVLQGLSIILIVLYFISLLAWKLVLKKISAVIRGIKVTKKNCESITESFMSHTVSGVHSSTPLLSGQTMRSTY